MSICAKCSDQFSAYLTETGNPTAKKYDGYVPDFFPSDHFGDYIEFTIDIDTGKILNWKKPTKKDLKIFV
jgi:hypothetical protein